MKLLISKGADANARNPAGATALMWAAGDAAKAKVLVRAGADVNAISKLCRTPLMIASATAGNLETVRLLLAKGASPKLVDENGDGPVGGAASAGLAIQAFLPVWVFRPLWKIVVQVYGIWEP